HRRHDRGLAHAAHAVGVARIRDFDDDGIDHGYVGAHRDPVVEKARVLEPSVGVVDVFLVQRPPDALYGTALHLPLDIGRMHRLAGILDGGVAQNGDPAGFAVHFDIDEVCGQAGTRALRVDGCVAYDRAAGLARGLRDLRERQFLTSDGAAAGRARAAIVPDHFI